MFVLTGLAAIGIAVALATGLWPLALAGTAIIVVLSGWDRADSATYEAVAETSAGSAWPYVSLIAGVVVGGLLLALLGLAVSVSPH